MPDKDVVIRHIQGAFDAVPHPGDPFLQGSHEGTEPAEVAAALSGIRHWRDVHAAVLDANAEALGILSEGGFRFFLPAYLLADLNGQLQTADPLFHLVNGFHDTTMTLPVGTRVFTKRLGRRAFVNPRRYGAMTWEDHARCRLSIFTREEARAIVAYLQCRRDTDPHGVDREAIDAALESFWLERARSAPEEHTLMEHVIEEDEYVKEITKLDRKGRFP